MTKGRPPRFPERVNLHLPPGTLRRLAAIAKDYGRSVPTLLRVFVEDGLAAREEDRDAAT